MLTFLIGGARSGKSAHALSIAGRSGHDITFVATAEPRDEEFTQRVARHRAERPESWETIEEPIELVAVLERVHETNTVIVDCLTLWVANLLEAGLSEEEIIGRAAMVGEASCRHLGQVIIVSNEVGSGIVPADAPTRRYRDVLGRVNTTIATASDAAYLVVAGHTLALCRTETGSPS